MMIIGLKATLSTQNMEKIILQKTSFHNLLRKVTYDPVHHYNIESPTSLSYSSNANQVDPTKELDLLKIYAYGVSRVADKSGLNTTLKDSSPLYSLTMFLY